MLDFSVDHHKVMGYYQPSPYYGRSNPCHESWLPATALAVERARNREGKVNPFLDMDQLIPPNAHFSYTCCAEAYKQWRLAISREVGKIPAFAQFIMDQMHA
jgi:hypothetical protein